MRYLYADSTDFPYEFDFLAGLERLLLHGGRIAAHAAAIEELESGRQLDATRSQRSVEGLQRWLAEAHTALTTAELTTEAPGPLADDVGARVRDLLDQLAGEAEAAEAARVRRENGVAHDAVVDHRRSMRVELETLLLGTSLGGRPKRTVIQLRDGAYGFTVTRTLPGAIDVDFIIDEAKMAPWTGPRTVEAVSGAMEVQVGMKKKFLRRDLTRELVRIGELVVVEAKLIPDGAEVRLEKKPGSGKPPLLLEMRRDGETVDVTIERESADGTDLFPAVPSDAEKIEGLWESLEETARRAYASRAGVRAVFVDGHDVLGEGQPLIAIDRLANELGPVVGQLASRTPNDHELCLKVEDEAGKREERYIRRRDLHALLEEAGSAAVERFGHLTALTP